MTTAILLVTLAGVPQLDIEQYLTPESKPVKCGDTIPDYPVRLLPFDDTTIVFHKTDDGELLSLTLDPGYLVSECELMKITRIRSEAKRLRTEVRAITKLRTKEFELWRLMERQYREQLNRYQHPGWIKRHQFVIGMAIGIVTVGSTVLVGALLAR